jgi:hypothetical protein
VHVTAKVNYDQLEKLVLAKLKRAYLAIKQRVAVGGMTEDAAVGFFGFIKKAYNSVKRVVNKIAKSSVVRGIKNAVKSVIKSKYVGYALSAVAVIYPPVGVPAAAAFYSAQKVLSMAEKGGAAAKKAVKLVGGLRKLAKKPGKDGVKARRALKVLKISKNWRAGVRRTQSRRRSPVRRTRRVQRVRGLVRLPSGKVAKMQGTQKGGRLTGTLVTRGAGGRMQRGRFSARVAGGDAAELPPPVPVSPTLEMGSLYD